MSFAKPEKTPASGDSAQPQVKRYTCAAIQCPMAGTIFSGGSGGMCAYHYATNGADWGHITRVLIDWQCVTAEINTSRMVLTNPEYASKPSVIAALYDRAWARLEPAAGTWAEELKPQPDKSGSTEGYGAWCQRLERFMGQRVVESLRHQIGSRKAA